MISQIIKTWIQKAALAAGFEDVDFKLEHPTELAYGDYATNVAMVIAGQQKANPRAIAETIKTKLEENIIAEVESVSVAGPGFINISLSKEFFAKEISSILDTTDAYGKNTNKSGEKWVIEHTSPNPNKAMHLGHLRNNVTGMAIANIAEANGVSVVRDEVDNNRGIAIAKLMWGYLKFARKDSDQTKTDIAYWYDHQDEWQIPADRQMRPDRFVDQLYVQGADDFKNPEVESIVRNFVVLWEAHDEAIWELWKKVLHYSYEGQNLTLKRLGNKWDFVWREHEHYQKGKDLVEEGLSKGVFKVGEGGAIVTNFLDEKLPDTVLIKSDGTSLYITQDIALTKLKREKYGAQKLFWVIGPEQSLALQQLFRACEQLGIGKESDFTHIAYGYMSIMKNGQVEKMSSRAGNVIYIDDLIDMVKETVVDKMKNPTDEAAEKVAIAAVKFAILFTGRLTDTAFDIDRATNLDGDSGPYLQYTVARIHSLLEKAKGEGISALTSDAETTSVHKMIYRYPEVVSYALENLAPNAIATYLIELAREFNSFYNGNKIVDTEHAELSATRLALAQSVAIVIKNGLLLLGIEAPDSM